MANTVHRPWHGACPLGWRKRKWPRVHLLDIRHWPAGAENNFNVNFGFCNNVTVAATVLAFRQEVCRKHVWVFWCNEADGAGHWAENADSAGEKKHDTKRGKKHYFRGKEMKTQGTRGGEIYSGLGWWHDHAQISSSIMWPRVPLLPLCPVSARHYL